MNDAQIKGILAILALFAVCFIVVHGIRLAVIGLRALRKPPPEEEPKAEEKPPEPIYFLVERKKKKRPKKEYSEPKQINFK